MATIYCSNGTGENPSSFVGDDANDGSTKALAKATFVAAYNAANDGDRIVCMGAFAQYAETNLLGYLFLDKSGLNTGLEITSEFHNRKAVLSGPENGGTYSVRIASSGHRLHNIDCATSNDGQLAVLAAIANSSINDIHLRNVDLICNHDVGQTSNALIVSGSGQHSNWEISNVEVVDSTGNINGFQLSLEDFRISRSKCNLSTNGDRIGIRILPTCGTGIVEDCEFAGNIGFAQLNEMTVSSSIRIFNTVIRGRFYAALFNGADESNELRLTLSKIDSVSTINGLSTAGDNIVAELYDVESVAENLAIAFPGEAGNNIVGRIYDSLGITFGNTSGHSILYGAGSKDALLFRSRGYSSFVPFAAVIKGDGGTIVDSVFAGGQRQTLLFKGATNWTARGNTLIQPVGGSALETRNSDTLIDLGDGNPPAIVVSSGNDIQDTDIIVTSGDVLDIGAIPDQTDGTDIVDLNRYTLTGDAVWGSVQGTVVTSLTDVRNTWNNDNDARSTDVVSIQDQAVVLQAINDLIAVAPDNKPAVDGAGLTAVDKTGYTLTAASMAELFDDSDAQAQLTDFLNGLSERFDEPGDAAVATISTLTVQHLLDSPEFVQLIADAFAARTAAEGNGTLLQGIDAVKPANAPLVNAAGEIGTSNPAVDHSAQLQAIMDEIVRMLRAEEPVARGGYGKTETKSLTVNGVAVPGTSTIEQKLTNA